MGGGWHGTHDEGGEMQRITADADGLVRQAHYTAEIYLTHALQWVIAAEIPQAERAAYVAIYVQACTQDFLAAAGLEGLQEVTEAVEGLRAALEAQA
jgi:hypothetical protein